MATLQEYFAKFGNQTFCFSQRWPLRSSDGLLHGEVTARLHLDVVGMCKYVSFLVPKMTTLEEPEIFALNEIQRVLDFTLTDVDIRFGNLSDVPTNASELTFTNTVYVFTDRYLDDAFREKIARESAPIGHRVLLRDASYVEQQNRFEKPLAFISHDSNDKAEIAELLAIKLQTSLCPVWYDEFSLSVGDSLRESIERGLIECKKCILVLTPNFLNNNGWTKTEYDSIFTRELVEQRKVILPIWHNVTRADVYRYSPMLADRVALKWDKGLDWVAGKIIGSLNSSE